MIQDSENSKGKLKKIFLNEGFLFLIGKYFGYALTFLNSIFIAKFLGIYYFGIYGFFLLLLRYVSYVNPGSHYAINVVLSTENRNDLKNSQKIVSNGLIINFITSILIFFGIISIDIWAPGFINKYNFSTYLLPTAIIGILVLTNTFFMNLFRSFSRFYEILCFLILPQIAISISFFFMEGENKLEPLIYTFLIGNVLALLIFLVRTPIKLIFNFDTGIVKMLLKRGLSLVFYNASFYFIVISTRTIVSYFYTVEQMGIFSFANSIAQASILIIGALSFVFFPKILNKLKQGTNDIESIRIIHKIRSLFTPTVFLIVFFTVFLYDLILIYLPDYQSSTYIFYYLIMLQLFLSMVIGYSDLLISRGLELKIAKFAFLTVVLNIITSYLLIKLFSVDLSTIAFSVASVSLIYSVLVIREGKKLLHENYSFISIIKEIVPVKYIVPFAALFIERTFLEFQFSSVIPFIVLMLFLNRDLVFLYKQFINIFSNQNSIKF